jgi:hypothetical protein
MIFFMIFQFKKSCVKIGHNNKIVNNNNKMPFYKVIMH